MNTIKNLKFLILAVFGLMTINSCVQDDEYDLPPANCVDNWVTNLTLDELFAQVDSSEEILYFDTDVILEGYVISSDSTGNFFKTVSIQNSRTNPTRGIQVEMDRTNLFNNFPLGSKIKVNLKGLYAGYDGVLLKIGETYESNGVTRVGRMAESKIDSHVVTTCESIEDATPVVFASIQDAKNSGVINTLVTIENVQFQQTGVTYADAAGQETVNLNLEGATSETNDERIILRNSGFADFANETVPEGSGKITAVLSKYNSDWQLFIRDTDDVQFNNPRFEGEPGGGSGPIGGSTAAFEGCLTEDFESYAANNDNFPIYVNDAAIGSRYWQIKTFDGNKYIQMSSHNSTDDANEVYFIVPVNFNNADSFSFKTKDGYDNGDVLKVYYTTNYTLGQGISGSNLTEITSSFTISSGNSDGYGDSFVESGSYSLASISGNGAIVFKYEGTQSVTTTMQIDDIQVVDNESTDCGGGNGGGDEEPVLGDGFAFPGADFENWNTFLAGLNSFGIKPYATQSMGTGENGSASLRINTSGASANDYVFTTLAHSELPDTYSSIKFKVKGTSDKSISINLYKTDGTYYRFNLEDVSGNKTVIATESNQYTGVINTNGQWVEITLDLTGISDLNTNADITEDFFALKIGSAVAYDLHLDNFMIQ